MTKTKMHTFVYDGTPYISLDDLKIWLQKELIHHMEQGNKEVIQFVKYEMAKFEEFEKGVIKK